MKCGRHSSMKMVMLPWSSLSNRRSKELSSKLNGLRSLKTSVPLTPLAGSSFQKAGSLKFSREHPSKWAPQTRHAGARLPKTFAFNTDCGKCWGNLALSGRADRSRHLFSSSGEKGNKQHDTERAFEDRE